MNAIIVPRCIALVVSIVLAGDATGDTGPDYLEGDKVLAT